MSNENLARLFKLWAMICKMIMDGVRDAEKVADILQDIVNERKTYLRELFTGVEVGATSGTETFQSSGIFTGGVYGLDVPEAAKGKATKASKATVWELILDGTSVLFFGSLGENRKRFTEHQVVQFFRDNRDKFKRPRVTFFEMEGDVVAYVSFDNCGRPEVNIHEFSCDKVWHAKYRHRVISLQQ